MKQLYTTPLCLYDKIIESIEKEKDIRRLKKRLVIISLFFILSAGLFTGSILLLRYSVIKSGFQQTFLLLFSDFSIVISSFSNFAMSLLENLPAMEISLLLIITLFFVAVTKILVKSIKKIISINHLKI